MQDFSVHLSWICPTNGTRFFFKTLRRPVLMFLKASSPVSGTLEESNTNFLLDRSRKPLFEVTINCASSLLWMKLSQAWKRKNCCYLLLPTFWNSMSKFHSHIGAQIYVMIKYEKFEPKVFLQSCSWNKYCYHPSFNTGCHVSCI